MPFAHCLDCGSSALIDPSGRCPEGHAVGTAGSRVASAIAVGGAHPDEPKPWVGVVDLDPAIVDASPPEPRVARPLSVAGSELNAPASTPAAAADDLLRELHALGDLGDLGDLGTAPATVAPASAGPAAVPAPAAAAPPAPAPLAPAPLAPAPPAPAAAVPAAPAGPAAPPSSPQEATDLGDLASLAAAIESLDDRGATPPPAAVAAPQTSPAPAFPAAVAAPQTSPAPAFPATDSLWAPAEPIPAQAPPPFARVEATTPDAPAPSAVATAPPAPATSTATPFDGSFTARGDGVGRRTQRRLDEKAARKGLFRR